MSKATALKKAIKEAAERISGSPRQIRDQFDLVRYDPARGMPKSLDPVLTPENEARLMEIAKAGIAKGGHNWYDTKPIKDEFIRVLGDEKGAAEFDRFMDFVAATSPRSQVPNNIRRASYFRNLEKQGKAFSNVKQGDLPPGYGHIAHNSQSQLLSDLEGGRHFEEISRPKVSSFAENLNGNL